MRLLNPSVSFMAAVQRMLTAYKTGHKLIATLLWNLIYYKYGCLIAPSSSIDPTVYFPHPVGIVIGGGVVIGPGCVIYQNVTLGRSKSDVAEYPELRENCTVYVGSSVLGTSVLGSGSTVGAHSMVVNTSTERDALLVGVPARLVGYDR